MRVPVFVWQEKDAVEEGAIQQLKNLAKLPFAYKHIAAMGDCHQGYGMPIGGVLATENYIIPNAVGVGMGCGMSFVRTSFQDELNPDTIKKVMEDTRRVIPMGMGKNHKQPCDISQMPSFAYTEVVEELIQPAMYQLGTLGAGNHFIELQRDENNYLCVMLHSGSRRFGKSICDHYNRIARDFNKKYFSTVDDKQDLAFLHAGSREGIDYYQDMRYATEFAFLNREKMMHEIMGVLQDCVQKYEGKTVKFDESITNKIHNYVNKENHFGKDVFVHRKGAISAKLDEVGIIPGSQGSASYIVEGLGNKESFESCSHGAGRKMSRRQAQKTLNLEEEIKHMDDLGVIHGMRDVNDLDESASAYKNIEQVMQQQQDLARITHKLIPIAVLKG